jgi:integrase
MNASVVASAGRYNFSPPRDAQRSSANAGEQHFLGASALGTPASKEISKCRASKSSAAHLTAWARSRPPRPIRHGHREATMILLAFSHGLRAAELCDLRWDQSTSMRRCCMCGGSRTAPLARMFCPRAGCGQSACPVRPLRGDELRALRRLQRGSETSPFVFVSEWGSPFITGGFARLI